MLYGDHGQGAMTNVEVVTERRQPGIGHRRMVWAQHLKEAATNSSILFSVFKRV
jgi:hypothetical protein